MQGAACACWLEPVGGCGVGTISSCMSQGVGRDPRARTDRRYHWPGTTLMRCVLSVCPNARGCGAWRAGLP